MAEPLIVVISGPSGAGKNSVTAPLREQPDRFAFSVTYTTRDEIRPGEVNGRDYNFISDEKFQRGIDNGEFLEWEQIYQFKYGTKKQDFEELLRSGRVVIATIDVKGAANLKKLYPNVITVFIMPPSPEEAAIRLKNRETEDETSQKLRQERYQFELEQSKLSDYVIINDDLEKAQVELQDIISSRQAKLAQS